MKGEAFRLKTLKTDAPVSVRPAVLKDLDFVMDIECRSFPSPWSRETLKEELDGRNWSHVQVAESGGNAVGFMIYWIVLDEMHLLNLAVHPDWRRMGIAAAMLHRLMSVANKENTAKIFLEVRTSNRSAQMLYRKFGFKPIGIRPKYYTDNGEDAVVMCLRRKP
jgi:[ribosomal protein S18]-alanine N-acetyltransferase